VIGTCRRKTHSLAPHPLQSSLDQIWLRHMHPGYPGFNFELSVSMHTHRAACSRVLL
jgi:hypothetical protein